MNNSLQQQPPSPPMSTASLQHPGQIRNVHQLTQHIAHPQHGGHVPVWLKPHLAAQIIAQHAPSGNAIPHPGIPIPMPKPQGYESGGVIPQQQHQIDQGGIGNPTSATGDHGVQPLDWPHPTQFGNPDTSPTGNPHPSPIFLGPPVRPGMPPQGGDRPRQWPGVPSSSRQWPNVGNPTANAPAPMPISPRRMSTGGAVKSKDKNKSKGKK